MEHQGDLEEQVIKITIIFFRDEFSRVRSDPDQLLGAKKIASNPITLISGRGGTGKTEVVTSVLNVAEELITRPANAIEDDGIDDVEAEDLLRVMIDSPDGDSRGESPSPSREKKPRVLSNGPVLYTAPTGKAAGVIRKRIKRNAFTIHQIIASFKMRKGDEWKFGQTQILAVDECSMVSLEVSLIVTTNLIAVKPNVFCSYFPISSESLSKPVRSKKWFSSAMYYNCHRSTLEIS